MLKVSAPAAIAAVACLTHAPAGAQPNPVAQITAIADASPCGKVNWGYAKGLPAKAHRGIAPKVYMRGVALVFARAVCQPGRADVKTISTAQGKLGKNPEDNDALTWYDPQFKKLGMSNDVTGPNTLRHLYTLLIALGMQESSGAYCTGRDKDADFAEADNAEAGLLQT